jgi:hypothetical protein
MQKVYENLFVGSIKDAYTVLNVWSNPGEEMVDYVLDVTPDIPSRQWHRAKGIKLYKLGFVSGASFEITRLKKAIKFIHEARTQQKTVMVVCRNGQHRSVMVCFAYLAHTKGWSFEDTLSKLQEALGEVDMKEPYITSLKRFIRPGVGRAPSVIKVEVRGSSLRKKARMPVSKFDKEFLW